VFKQCTSDITAFKRLVGTGSIVFSLFQFQSGNIVNLDSSIRLFMSAFACNCYVVFAKQSDFSADNSYLR
jgi:hypothetical protein